MGWTPAETRAASLADFITALDGFLLSRGAAEPEGLDADDVAELRALLEDDA